MKKNMLFSVLVLSTSFLSLTTFCQDIKESQVPAAVKSAFSKAYHGSKAKWSMEDGKYEASFKKNSQDVSVLIDKSGSLTETETDVPMNQLPVSVATYIREHYKGAKIKETSKIVKSNGETMYEAMVNGKDLMFDSNGKFIKEVKE